ncbi:MAG: hypothetical protein ACRBBO_05960 [Cognatishimia sp.]
MADNPQVEFRAAGWSPAVARDLTKIGDASAHDLAVFERQVRSGEWQLWEIIHGDDRLGCLIWSVEQEGESHSLIVNAAAAKPVSGVDITRAIVDAFTALAIETNARSVRCWTIREGMRRKLQKIGAKTRYVMEIEI